MINPHSINLSLLPSVPLARRKELPELPAIYFVMDSQGEVCYIGQTKNPRQRFTSHNRLYEFKQTTGAKIAYLLISEVSLLKKVERALIEHFEPRFNGSKYSNSEHTKRRLVTFRIDERIIEAIEKAATEVNNSKNKYLELLMLEHCIDKGLLPKNFKPLGETRGGDRTSKAERTKKEGDDD